MSDQDKAKEADQPQQAEETAVPEQPVEQGDQEALEIAAEAAADLSILQQELNTARDQVLRTQAEMQNLRRRVERDIENAHKYAVEKLVSELLPVVDDLERAIAAGKTDSKADVVGPLMEGVELTLKNFESVLTRFKVEAVEPHGQPFDPALHQAMSMVPNPEVEPNTVIEVFQKGYTLNGRLVRPAMVVVAKPA